VPHSHPVASDSYGPPLFAVGTLDDAMPKVRLPWLLSRSISSSLGSLAQFHASLGYLHADNLQHRGKWAGSLIRIRRGQARGFLDSTGRNQDLRPGTGGLIRATRVRPAVCSSSPGFLDGWLVLGDCSTRDGMIRVELCVVRLRTASHFIVLMYIILGVGLGPFDCLFRKSFQRSISINHRISHASLEFIF
jgi:hypothetical protein